MAYQKKLPLNLRSFAATPAAPTVSNIGTAGSTAYSYKAVAVAADGNHTAASTAGSTSTGNATLDGTNYNHLAGLAVPVGFDHVDIYRTAGGPTQGKIGSISGSATTFDDQGAVGDASTAPATASTSLGVSDPARVDSFESFTLWLIGLTGTWKLQFSPDQGTTWFDEAVFGAQTNAGYLDVGTKMDMVRVVISAQTAGVPTGYAQGLYSHEGG